MQKIRTYDDIARALGVSKSTVSRSISGKGRIGEKTRRRVLDLIEKEGFRPNAVAKSLAERRTGNIALIVPTDFAVFDMPFLRRAMSSVFYTAAHAGFDIILTINSPEDFSPLENIIVNRKIDGAILSRTTKDDPITEFLYERNIPFVAMGRLDNPAFPQVDNDQVAACRELTATALAGEKKRKMAEGEKHPGKGIALFGGSLSAMVNQNRLDGFTQAFEAAGERIAQDRIYTELKTHGEVAAAVNDAIAKKIDCFICMDDVVCLEALHAIEAAGLEIPEDVRIASFYDSRTLETYFPGITAINFDTEELGKAACSMLLKLLCGDAESAARSSSTGRARSEDTSSEKNTIIPGYRIIERKSTKMP